MRRRRAAVSLTALVAFAVGTAACTSDDGDEVRDLLLERSDLPSGFAVAEDVDDTITTFCATEDATAGLQASEREVAGFQREGGGASVIQLAFRFRDGDAATFVEQAEGALSRCSGVPDATGLAFEYEALSPGLLEVVEEAGDARTGRFGTSVGSGNLTVDVVVLHREDVATLVAVLGLDLPRAELDDLAAQAFAAVVDRL